MTSDIQKSKDIHDKVREGYAQIAQQQSSCCGPQASCCGAGNPDQLAASLGYQPSDLSTLPDGANMGLSCGNPTALAALRPGEIVLDLGSGGGFDAFIAGRNVGANGRVIGVDMTHEMLSKARTNLLAYRNQTGLDNVEFRLGEIEYLPVMDSYVDVIISNCVINLSPNKPQVWREMYRVLKPGGRVAVSDLALLQPLPEAVRTMVEALVGCIAGAVLVSETEAMARDAGFTEINLEPKAGYIDAMTEWNDPMYKQVMSALPQGSKASDYIVSLNVSARKA